MAISPARDDKSGQRVIGWLTEARPDITWPFTANEIIDATMTTSVVTYWRTRGGMHYEAINADNWDDTPVGRTVTKTLAVEVFGEYPELGDVVYGSQTTLRTTITEKTERREFDKTA